METRKEFEMERRDGTKANFIFVKPEGSVWHWDVPNHSKDVPDGCIASFPLPDVNLDKAKSLKDCLNLVGEKRNREWVEHIVVDLLIPIEEKKK